MDLNHKVTYWTVAIRSEMVLMSEILPSHPQALLALRMPLPALWCRNDGETLAAPQSTCRLGSQHPWPFGSCWNVSLSIFDFLWDHRICCSFRQLAARGTHASKAATKAWEGSHLILSLSLPCFPFSLLTRVTSDCSQEPLEAFLLAKASQLPLEDTSKPESPFRKVLNLIFFSPWQLF